MHSAFTYVQSESWETNALLITPNSEGGGCSLPRHDCCMYGHICHKGLRNSPEHCSSAASLLQVQHAGIKFYLTVKENSAIKQSMHVNNERTHSQNEPVVSYQHISTIHCIPSDWYHEISDTNNDINCSFKTLF